MVFAGNCCDNDSLFTGVVYMTTLLQNKIIRITHSPHKEPRYVATKLASNMELPCAFIYGLTVGWARF